MAVLKSARLSLVALAALLLLAPAACAQPPVEVVGQAEVMCSPASTSGDLVAVCPGLPGPPVPWPIASANPKGFVVSHAVPARADERGAGYYVFGESEPGHGGPYLAFAPAGSLAEPEAWEFFTGRGIAGSINWVSFGPWQDHTDDQGNWSPGRRAQVFTPEEANADCGGFHGFWNAGLSRWLMFYACKGEGRVRVATESWGPWSEPLVLGAGADARVTVLLSSADGPELDGPAERRTQLYWLGQKKGEGPKVFRSNLREAGAE